jgi:hypothetical protein
VASQAPAEASVDPLPDVPTADPGTIPPDEGDLGRGDPLDLDLFDAHGLDAHHRASAQKVIVDGARLLLDHAAAVHYTENFQQRWEGIANRIFVRDGRFPTHGDCSSTATWLLWNGLGVHLGMGDVVNGEHWAGGFTGTMLQHGREISASDAEVGDLVIYGTGAPGKHVALCLGGGLVFSHGSEPGPFKLPLRYRPDVLSVRRYF